MPSYPEIRACLICESVRIEQRRKLTVLGLYGVTPFVKILLKNIPGSIVPITFLLFCEPPEKATRVTVQILSEDEKEKLTEPAGVDLAVPEYPSGAGNALIITFNEIKLEKAGTYKLKLRLGEWQDQAQFKIAQGETKDFE